MFPEGTRRRRDSSSGSRRGRTPARRASRSRPACRSFPPRSAAPTGCPARPAPRRVRRAGRARRLRRIETRRTLRGGDRTAHGEIEGLEADALMRPLLVVDGDSLAHRAYHALPKSIRRAEGKPADALVGFTNMLLRLWEAEQPRAVLVGWDTLDSADVPARGFAATRAGASSTTRAARAARPASGAWCARSASPRRRRAGYEADDFLAAAVRDEEAAAERARRHLGPRLVPARQRPRRPSCSRRAASASSRASDRRRCASATASSRSRCRTSSPARGSVGQAPGRARDRPEEGRRRPAGVRHARGDARGRPVRGRRRRSCGSSGEWRR